VKVSRWRSWSWKKSTKTGNLKNQGKLHPPEQSRPTLGEQVKSPLEKKKKTVRGRKKKFTCQEEGQKDNSAPSPKRCTLKNFELHDVGFWDDSKSQKNKGRKKQEIKLDRKGTMAPRELIPFLGHRANNWGDRIGGGSK